MANPPTAASAIPASAPNAVPATYLDFSVGKRFNVGERNYFDFRVELFNALNHVSWAPPGLNISTPNTFGAIGAQVQNPRNIQFGLKYQF